MISNFTPTTKIEHDIAIVRHKQLTGELVIGNPKQKSQRWHLYFYLGRLVYATGEAHRVRRWYRALKQHCPNLPGERWSQRVNAVKEPWESQLLTQGVIKHQISLAQAKAIIESNVREVFFAIVGQQNLISSWHPGGQQPHHGTLLSADQLLQEAQVLSEQWKEAGLGRLQCLLWRFSPDLAPVLKHPQQLQQYVSPKTYRTLTKLLNGENTFWDIALQMRQPLAVVTRSLLSLIQKGVVELKEIPDLPCPVTAIGRVSSINNRHKPVIACIDDSPLVGEIMEQILAPAGYEVIKILDPLKAITTCLEKKPALIFLDLVMPNTNGYEFCGFLRKTAAFRHTPIVILTGHNSVIDRARAKLAGCSDFISKPASANKVLQVVQKQLKSPAPTEWERQQLLMMKTRTV